MIASIDRCSLKDTPSIARACVITFQGNVSKKVYKDIFEQAENFKRYKVV